MITCINPNHCEGAITQGRNNHEETIRFTVYNTDTDNLN